MSDFAANVYAFTGFLIGPPGDQGAPFSFLLTDIGFNGNIVTTPADAGTTPDVTVYARGGATDLVFGEDYTEWPYLVRARSPMTTIPAMWTSVRRISVTTGFGYDKCKRAARIPRLWRGLCSGLPDPRLQGQGHEQRHHPCEVAGGSGLRLR